jgi:hypothetical protein
LPKTAFPSWADRARHLACGGAATLLETTLEIAASPVSYVYDLTLAHDITVTILHASNNDQFPTVATHYKVTAQFDRGATPYTQTLPCPPGR